MKNLILALSLMLCVAPAGAVRAQAAPGASQLAAQARAMPGGLAQRMIGMFLGDQIRTNGLSDPGSSSMTTLVMRPDVRSEIKVSADQRNALDQMQQTSRSDFQTGLMQQVQQLRQSMRGQNAQSMTPEERQQVRQQGLEKVQQYTTTFMNGQEDRLAHILRPTQMARLRQLDLRWRGLLATGDPHVADDLKLDAKQRIAARAQLENFRTAQQRIMLETLAKLQGNANGQNRQPNGIMGMTRLQQEDAIVAIQKSSDKARAPGETVVRGLLTPEQAAAWASMLGAPFTFRSNW